MRTITRALLVITGSAALVGGIALPASAQDVSTDTNAATVVVQGGFLVLDTTAADFTLGDVAPSVTGSTTTGTLSGVNVTDLNSDGLGWSSTATLSNLTYVDGNDQTVDPVIDVSGATYESTVTSAAQAGVVVTTSGSTVTAVTEANNAATWNSTVTIDVPNTTTKGTYTGTLTHSLL